MRLPKSKAVYATAAAAMTLFGGVVTTYGATYKTVTVQDSGQRKTIRGFGTGTVGQFLEKYGIHVNKNQRVSPALDSPVKQDMTVEIVSPKTIKIDYQGRFMSVSTFDESVGQLLKDQGLVLGTSDHLSEPTNASLSNGEEISIHNTSKRVSTRTQDLPFQTIRRRSSALSVGKQSVVTHGVKGLLQVKTTSVYRDGHRVSQNVVQTVVRHPVNAVVEVGTREVNTREATTGHEYTLSSRSSGPGSDMMQTAITVLATAYTAGGYTATGRPARPGVIAVDPNVIPLGSTVYVPGIGQLVAADTGGAINGRHIDICMSSNAAARAWGERTITVYIVK